MSPEERERTAEALRRNGLAEAVARWLVTLLARVEVLEDRLRAMRDDGR